MLWVPLKKANSSHPSFGSCESWRCSVPGLISSLAFVPGRLQLVLGELLLGAEWFWGKPPEWGHAVPAPRWAEAPGKEPWQGRSGSPGPGRALPTGDGNVPGGVCGSPSSRAAQPAAPGATAQVALWGTGMPWHLACGFGEQWCRARGQGTVLAAPRQTPKAGGGGGIPAMRLASPPPGWRSLTSM